MSDKTTCQATELGVQSDCCSNPVVGCVALLKHPNEPLYVCKVHADELRAQLGDAISFTEIATEDLDAQRELDKHRQDHSNMRAWLHKALLKPGWGVLEGPDPNDGYSSLYTCGAWISTNHPELVCFSLPPHDLGRYLNRLVETADRAKCFGQFQTYQKGQDLDETWPDGPPTFRLIAVESKYKAEYLPLTTEIYGHTDYPALQLVWSDPRGRYPWMRGFDRELVGEQPVLGPHRRPRARRPA